MTALSRIDARSTLQITNAQSTANTALTLTIAAETGKRHHIAGFDVVVTDGTPNSEITVELKDGSTVIYHTKLTDTDGATLRVFPSGAIQASRGNAVSLEVGAGGTSVISRANILYFTL